MTQNYSKQILIDNHFRFWVSIFTFIVALLLVSRHSPLQLLSITVLFVSYALLFGLAHLDARRGQGGPILQYSLLTLDLLAVTAAIHYTGRMQSPLYILYLVVFGVCIYHESLANFVYALVLTLLLYGGVAIYEQPIQEIMINEIAGQLLLMLVLTGVLYSILRLMSQERRLRERLVSQTLTMGKIADLLSGTIENSRETVKSISRLIEEEMGPEGFKCRITIHKPDQGFLPPSGGRLGIHIPIGAGESIFGTLVVTREKKIPFSPSEYTFFTSVSRSLGLYLHRSRLWEECHGIKPALSEAHLVG